jgi:hypothetical protein
MDHFNVHANITAKFKMPTVNLKNLNPQNSEIYRTLKSTKRRSGSTYASMIQLIFTALASRNVSMLGLSS